MRFDNRVRLADVCEIRYGKDHKKLGDGDIPAYGSGGLMRYVDSTIHNKKSVLIPRKGTLSNLFLVDPPFWTVDTLFWTDIDEEKILPEYLFYQLKTMDLASKNVGTAVPSLTTSVLNEITIALPSIKEQEKTVSPLISIDRKIEANKHINDNLQQQLSAIFREWFIDAPESAEWPRGTFADLIDHTISGDWGKDTPTGNYTEMVYCIRGADIPEVKAGNKGKMPTRFILSKNYTAKKLVDGDIVVEISGGSPTQSTGRAAPVSESLLGRYNRGMVCTNFCKAIKPKQGYSMFVYHYWQHLYDAGVFFGYENGTTGIKNLDINGFIETEEIVIPPLNIVGRFDAVCQAIANKVYANGLENERLANLRDALLPKLMSGEIDVASIEI